MQRCPGSIDKCFPQDSAQRVGPEGVSCPVLSCLSVVPAARGSVLSCGGAFGFVGVSDVRCPILFSVLSCWDAGGPRSTTPFWSYPLFTCLVCVSFSAFTIVRGTVANGVPSVPWRRDPSAHQGVSLPVLSTYPVLSCPVVPVRRPRWSRDTVNSLRMQRSASLVCLVSPVSCPPCPHVLSSAACPALSRRPVVPGRCTSQSDCASSPAGASPA